MDREAALSLALDAARDPSQAARIAAWIAESLRAEQAAGEGAHPPGYLYAGAHRWIARVENLATEPLPPTPGAPPITSSANEPVEIRTSFDALIIGVSGFGVLTPQPRGLNVPITAADLAVAELLSCARDGRDLFTVEYGLDGQITFGTDGRRQQMYPASVVVGDGPRPRALAWTVRRNQIITVRFRNISNVITSQIAASPIGPPDLRLTAEVAFHVVNMERP